MYLLLKGLSSIRPIVNSRGNSWGSYELRPVSDANEMQSPTVVKQSVAILRT